MRLDQIVLHVIDGLKPYAVTAKAALRTARDPFDVLEMLMNSPDGLMIIVHYAGCETTGESDGEPQEATYQETNELIEIVVGSAMGPGSLRDKALVQGSGNRPGLIQRIGEVRALALSFVLPDDETTLRRLKLRGCDAVTTPEGLSLAAYRLRFSIHAVVEVGEDTVLPKED